MCKRQTTTKAHMPACHHFRFCKKVAKEGQTTCSCMPAGLDGSFEHCCLAAMICSCLSAPNSWLRGPVNTKSLPMMRLELSWGSSSNHNNPSNHTSNSRHNLGGSCCLCFCFHHGVPRSGMAMAMWLEQLACILQQPLGI